MKEIREVSKQWEIKVEVGNDWGEKSQYEIRTYDTYEEVEQAVKHLDYYDRIIWIKDVVEYGVFHVTREDD